MARRIVLAVLVALAVAIGALVLWWEWAPLHRGSDVHADTELFSSVPPYPTARETSRAVEELQDDSSCGLICIGPSRTHGYRISVEYDVPKGTRARDVVGWYAHHLRGWHRVAEPVPTIGDFHRGGATFYVDAQSTGDLRSLGVIVDAG